MTGMLWKSGLSARLLVAYNRDNRDVKKVVNTALETLGRNAGDLVSVLGRHAARALEAKIVADRCAEWIGELVPGKSTFTDFDIPARGSGYGLTEAPRGALGIGLKFRTTKFQTTNVLYRLSGIVHPVMTVTILALLNRHWLARRLQTAKILLRRLGLYGHLIPV